MKQDTKYKLLLVDGSALLHRAYHAYPALTTRQGQVVGAVYGVASMLVSALESEQPTQAVVAWDLPAPTFRHEKYIAYKAQRAKADEEMVEQIPTVKEVIAAMGLLQIAREGYEADDIIGTIVNTQIREHADTQVVILSGDMDLTQLVNERTKLLTPPRGRVEAKMYGPLEVAEKLGVHPKQVVDYKALVGDASDNIPGVRGIGPKTAAELLRQFGTLDNVYAAVNPKSQAPNPKQIRNSNYRISETVKKKLIENKESALLSQELARIKTDMEIELVLEEMEGFDLRGDSLKAKLEELNFRSLIRRIWKDPTSPEASLGAGGKKVDERQGELF